MELLTSSVPRTLEAKTKLFGFELFDLVIILLYLSLSNLFFGSTALKIPLVWGVSTCLCLFLYFVKKGKPEGYLQDYAEYLAKPDIYFSAAPDIEYTIYQPFRLQADGKKQI